VAYLAAFLGGANWREVVITTSVLAALGAC
jgi:hypothetical protein